MSRRQIDLDRVDLASLSDSDLEDRAQSLASVRPLSSIAVRLGTISFWTVVAVLVVARAVLVDPASLRPHPTEARAPFEIAALSHAD